MDHLRSIWLPLTVATLFLLITVIFSIWFIAGTIIFTMDSIGRYFDYLRLRRVYQAHPNRVVTFWELFSSTRCSREVMMTVDKNSVDYYRLLGYKWYHILPDNIFRVDSFVMSREFWKNFWKPKL